MSLEFIGKSKVSLRLLKQLEILKPKNLDVLLYGESGSGRDFCARFLESNLKKIDAEFWNDEIKKLKDVENLYLDNLENLERHAQAELLQVIETRNFSNKKSIINKIFFSATKDILKKIEKGEFRKDLFQKIYSVRLEIPTLMERKEDIFFFVEHFLKIFSEKYKKKFSNLSKKLIDFIQTYTWKGNLRELELFLETQILFSKGNTLELCFYPSSFSSPTDLEIQVGIPLKEYEKQIILANLKYFQGNRAKTAEALGISERNLYRKIKEYDLN